MRVADLERALLDYWVGVAEGKEMSIQPRMGEPTAYERLNPPVDRFNWQAYYPSQDWAVGGPIIEREWIQVEPGSLWIARTDRRQGVDAYAEVVGPTPLIAAMRAYVASKFGEEVEDAPPMAG